MNSKTLPYWYHRTPCFKAPSQKESGKLICGIYSSFKWYKIIINNWKTSWKEAHPVDTSQSRPRVSWSSLREISNRQKPYSGGWLLMWWWKVSTWVGSLVGRGHRLFGWSKSCITGSDQFGHWWGWHNVTRSIEGGYRVITLIFKKYGNLPLCLENYALFSLPLIYKNILYTYPLRYIIYLGEPSGNTIWNYHSTFIQIFMHGYYSIHQKKNPKPSFSLFLIFYM